MKELSESAPVFCVVCSFSPGIKLKNNHRIIRVPNQTSYAQSIVFSKFISSSIHPIAAHNGTNNLYCTTAANLSIFSS